MDKLYSRTVVQGKLTGSKVLYHPIISIQGEEFLYVFDGKVEKADISTLGYIDTENSVFRLLSPVIYSENKLLTDGEYIDLKSTDVVRVNKFGKKINKNGTV